MRKIDAELFEKVLYDYLGRSTIDSKIGERRKRKHIIDDVCRLLRIQPTADNWIPCSERLPEEHDSTFAKLKGTDKWNECMWEKNSDKVNVTIKFEDGTKKVMTSYTQDGVWQCYKEYRTIKIKVIAWQPLPEPYKGE